MASIGGYIRFAIGILLSLEILRLALFNQPVSQLAIILATAFLISSVFYVMKVMG